MSKVIGSFEGFLNYWKEVAAALPEVKFFLYGGVELGMDRATGAETFDYPFMWLEQPTIKPYKNEQGQWSNRYTVGVSVITKVSIDDYEDQEAGVILTDAIMGKIMKMLETDGGSFKLMNVVRNFTLDEVDRGWALNHAGWRLSFELDLNAREWVNVL